MTQFSLPALANCFVMKQNHKFHETELIEKDKFVVENNKSNCEVQNRSINFYEKTNTRKKKFMNVFKNKSQQQQSQIAVNETFLLKLSLKIHEPL